MAGNKSLPEHLADLAFAALGYTHSNVTTAFGRRELETNAAPTLVVCVPIGSSIIAEADRPGDGGYTNVGRILYVRQLEMEWHCHDIAAGDDTDFYRTELLYLDTLRAVRNVGRARQPVLFSDETWHEQKEGADSFERFGTKISFKSVIAVPIYEARGGTKTLTGVPPFVTTGQLNDQETES